MLPLLTLIQIASAEPTEVLFYPIKVSYLYKSTKRPPLLPIYLMIMRFRLLDGLARVHGMQQITVVATFRYLYQSTIFKSTNQKFDS